MAIDKDELKKRAGELLKEVEKGEKKRQAGGISFFEVNALATQAANLVHSTLGPKSHYAESIRNALKQKGHISQWFTLAGVLQGLYTDSTLDRLGNIRHEVEAVVVSEIVTQARKLLATKGVHPAAAVIVACAGAEEFLRNWCEEKGISVPEKQRSINKFASELRAGKHLDLPVERRIQSWADYRNNAAHGASWEKITPEIAERLVKEVEDFLVDHKHVIG